MTFFCILLNATENEAVNNVLPTPPLFPPIAINFVFFAVWLCSKSRLKVESLFIGSHRLLKELNIKSFLVIEPVFVFDGIPPRFKQKELEERRVKKIEEEAKRLEAVDREDFEAARKHAVASMSLREQIVEDSKQLLKLLGVGIVVAPEEGEAQMAQMALY